MLVPDVSRRVLISQQTLYQSDIACVIGGAKCKTHYCLVKRAVIIINGDNKY